MYDVKLIALKFLFMKKLLLIPLLVLMAITGCNKDPIVKSPVLITPAAPVPIITTPTSPPASTESSPKAFAGSSKFVALPASSCSLYGGSSGNIEGYFWRKISGPPSFVIETWQSIITKVYKLEKGIYEFELTVTNKAGLSGKDTVTVSVHDVASPTKEIILKNVPLYCPMGCSVEIPNFNSFVPLGIFFRIYIKRYNSPDWIEAIHTDLSNSTDTYIFGLSKNTLWIYPLAEDAVTPDVKITF